MSDVPPVASNAGSTREDLVDLAAVLRQVDHIEPATRDRLAQLVEELDAALHEDVAPERADHLARGAAELVRALRDQAGAGPLESARGRLRDAVTTAGAEAPVATGAARGILEILNELGI